MCTTTIARLLHVHTQPRTHTAKPHRNAVNQPLEKLIFQQLLLNIYTLLCAANVFSFNSVRMIRLLNRFPSNQRHQKCQQQICAHRMSSRSICFSQIDSDTSIACKILTAFLRFLCQLFFCSFGFHWKFFKKAAASLSAQSVHNRSTSFAPPVRFDGQN